MKTPNITVNRQWSASKVRQVCIDNDLYTCGDNEDYSNMLDCVRDSYPDTENLYLIAMDIQKHSKGQTITNIMYLLANHAVITTFEIEGDDNI